MDIFSLIHPYLRNAVSWLPFLVGLISLRIMFASFMSPTQNKRTLLLCSLGIACCALLFNKEILAFWNVIIISGFLLISATFSSIRPQLQKKILTIIFTPMIGLGVLGLYSGYVIVFSTGPSMWPTTTKNLSADILNFTAYEKSNIDYGDDIHFNIPNNHTWPNGNYRKRVWALPGDVIEFKEHEVFINDLKVADCFVRDERIDQNIWYCDVVFPNGKSTQITWGLVNLFNENAGRRVLKDDEVFVLGDNTVESTDSRYWGSVPVNWVQGRFDHSPSIDPQKRVWKPYL